MNAIKITVPGIPQTKGSTRAFIPKGWKRPVITNDNPKNKGWAHTVSWIAKQKAPKGGVWTGPIELMICFRLPKPKSLQKKSKVWHTTRPDLDKLLRSVNDALQGVIYANDSQIVSIHCWKEYSDEPGIDVEVLNVLELIADERLDRSETGKAS